MDIEVGHRVGCRGWTQRMDTEVGHRGWMQRLECIGWMKGLDADLDT